MLFAVSGSQGSGKTTILNLLKEKGYSIVERKTSRSILEEWGVTLQQVNNDHNLTIKFQEEIFKRKFEDEQHAIDSSDVWFTERTYADLFTYALISLGKDNNYSDWLNQYFVRCSNHTKTYRRVFYVKAGIFTPVHDGVRGSNVHYSRMVDLTMYDFTKQMCWDQHPQFDIVELKTPEERIDYIEHYLCKMQLYKELLPYNNLEYILSKSK